MAVDTPAHIAILGAGPIGLEAALYARFLGYDVTVLEAGRACEHLLQLGHLRAFSPFGDIRSPLGLAAIRTQDECWTPPDDRQRLTYAELVERYYRPLAESDLLVDFIRPQTRAVRVGRQWIQKGEMPGSDDRAASDFRILTQSTEMQDDERIITCDVVIDATGTRGQPRWLGTGGLPAVGERAWQSRIEYRVPDVLGRDRPRYAGRHTLLAGTGSSAATTVVALAELAEQAPGTRVTWVGRREFTAAGADPAPRLSDDRLPARDELAQQANCLIRDGHPAVTFLAGTTVDAVRFDGSDETFAVQLSGQHAGEWNCHNIVANVGYRPDAALLAELHLSLCYATDAPVELGKLLCEHPRSADVLPTALTVPSLLTAEPDFYLLGAKSFGRDGRFTIAHGLRQIRDLFTILGDRADLDLYASMARIPGPAASS